MSAMLAVRDVAAAPADGMDGAAVAMACEVAGDALADAVFVAAAVMAFRPVAAAAEWAKPGTPSVALGAVWSLGGTMLESDRKGLDRWEPGFHAAVEENGPGMAIVFMARIPQRRKLQTPGTAEEHKRQDPAMPYSTCKP